MHAIKELTINISKDYSKYIGPREKRVASFSGEDFRERFLEENFKTYDRINIELDGTLGYPWDFLDETFGVMARKHGQKKFWEKFNLISINNYVIDKITYIVNHSKKENNQKQ
ncbi:MAG: STAS-like domain-containing protein [Deltaproteobacteria bacterium]|uniref:STAS-like domain-containing protein n=1 Tax=Desulfobacula sp. TaxID=2593537 RepID=UPI00198DA9DF|nr:STAS-like domain-containing protein [Candidatus Desulfobacula maris]MBL6993296.1 STAS-like domain-containing protein [Desulfobacula sp.]